MRINAGSHLGGFTMISVRRFSSWKRNGNHPAHQQFAEEISTDNRYQRLASSSHEEFASTMTEHQEVVQAPWFGTDFMARSLCSGITGLISWMDLKPKNNRDLLQRKRQNDRRL
jgi:hypothetical protein